MTAPVNNPNAPTAPPTTNYNDLALTLSKQYREASKQPKHSFGGFQTLGSTNPVQILYHSQENINNAAWSWRLRADVPLLKRGKSWLLGASFL